MKKKFLAVMIAAAMVFSLVACGSEPAAESSSEETAEPAADTASGLPGLTMDEVKVGAVFNTEFGTEGFSYALYQGLEELAASGVEVKYATSISESEECETAIESLIAEGCNVIYGLSYGFGEYVANVADKYPDVYFNHYAGSINKQNMATFFPKNYQSEYLCGIVAGAKTETNHIGYLVSFPIPECCRMIDAFTLGAQSVNPDVVVDVKWTNSWFDPATETATSQELVNSGCDVIIAYLDSLNAAIAGAELGAYGFGYATSGYETIPEFYLTNPACDWGSFFKNDIARICDGTWTGANSWLGMADGLVSLGEIYNSDDETIALVEEAEKGFMDGTLDIWAGEIVDNEGNVQVEAGSTMSDEELLSMMWLIKGVNGSAQ